MKHIVLVAATTGYQIRMFDDAARRLGIRLTLATDRCPILEDPWADRAVPVRFEDPEESSKRIPACDGVLAVGDRPALVAALFAKRTGVPFHSFEAATVCNDKALTRERFRAAGMLAPESVRIPICETNCPIPFPCVLKPLHLSASRGVIRANHEAEFQAARLRIGAMVKDPFLQVESFIPGREYALEGVMTRGVLQTLAVFEKPDPLDGPFFEESIYLTSCETNCQPMMDAAEAAVAALGLSHGAIHAEMRVNPKGVFVLEVAARPIGGLCAAALGFSGAMPLEELLLRHAAGEDVTGYKREADASGVMMIPIPRAGIYQSVSGMEDALRTPYITNCVITAQPGQKIVPLPEGASYLGFLFARAATAREVDAALRTAHAKLNFSLAATLPVI